jgi:hypothetical protein
MKQNKKIKPLVNVVTVEPRHVERYWPLAEFMITEALKYSGKYADSKHIYDYLLKDFMQCWIMFGSDEEEENKVFGVGITRVSEMPNFNQLEVVICTGKRRDLWEDQFVDTITKFANLMVAKDYVFGLDLVGRKFPKNGDGKRNTYN